jgi:hypothetical protein
MSSYAETATSVIRTLEFLLDKHGKAFDEPAAPRVSREILASIPRALPAKSIKRSQLPAVRMTPEMHDAVYAEATTTFRHANDIADAFKISRSTVMKIRSRRHKLYDPQRSEAFRYAHLKKPAA